MYYNSPKFIRDSRVLSIRPAFHAFLWLTKRTSNFAMIACKMQTWQPNCILVRKCSYAWWNSRNSHKTILGMWENKKLYKLNSLKPLKMKVTFSSVNAVVEFSGQGSTECICFRGLPINRLIGLSRSFSLICFWPKPKFFFEKNQLIFDIENWLWKYNFGTFWWTIIHRI